MNHKEIICRGCNELVDFKNIYTEKDGKHHFTDWDATSKTIDTFTKPTCDGIMVVCPICNYEDDISQLYVVFKNGGIMNMEDFYSNCTSLYKDNVTDEILYKEIDVLKNRKNKVAKK